MEIRGIKTLQTTVLSTMARILKRVLRIWEDSMSLRLQKKHPVKGGMENMQRVRTKQRHMSKYE